MGFLFLYSDVKPTLFADEGDDDDDDGDIFKSIKQPTNKPKVSEDACKT